ncbi:MAG: flavodoxin family protein [Planctomycetota bacterium]|nr:flavodoxin family protein [Planctomycetota bacterium]MDI6787268.1 flavodoxin family protein [Planctomycetota bacterium]
MEFEIWLLGFEIMYVLALYGSPRKDGNTDILLNDFLKGITSSTPEAQIERVYIRDLSISPCSCQDDNICLKTGECFIKDEMTPLYDKLLRADIVVLSSPVFFASVPAQVKVIIDRCQALWSRKYILKNIPPALPGSRKGFFISVGGTTRLVSASAEREGKDIFSGIQTTMKYFFKSINVDYVSNLFYEKIDSKGAILKHPTATKDAFEAGRKIYIIPP